MRLRHNGVAMQRLKKCGLLTLLIAGVSRLYAATPITEITLPGERLYTESITSTKDGTLIVGSLGKGNVSRIAYGTTSVEEWIKPGTNGLNAVFGVFADEKHKTLWVCSDKTDDGKGEAAVKSFDLKTAAPKGSYSLPGNGPFCNDIAVADNGTAYISDTAQATIWMLKPVEKTLVAAVQDPLLAGADGLAFGEKSVLYVNSVTKNKLLRVNLKPDGTSTTVTELKLRSRSRSPTGCAQLAKTGC
jgi:sugar lactone lactonase YvrE